MLPGFSANAALTGPRNVYYGRGVHELTGSAISPQQNVQVSRVEGGDVEPPCVCPCCMTVSGRLVCCN